MSEILTLRSQTDHLVDYRSVDISSYIPAFDPDELQLERDLQRVLTANGTREAVTEVAKGDTVQLSCQSELPRFNKENVMVPVGKGLFNRELETQLIGVKVGEPVTCQVKDTTVTVTVLSGTRVIPAELNDESVLGFGIEGVTTVQELKAYCVDKQIDRLLDDSEEFEEAAAMVWRALGDLQQCQYDEEELRSVEAKAAEMRADYEKRMNEPLSEEEQAYLAEHPEMTQEETEADEAFVMDHEAFFNQLAMSELTLAVMGEAFAKEHDCLLTMDDYEAYIDRWMPYYEGLTRDEVKQQKPVEEYTKQEYNEMICNDIDAYVIMTFKKAMNPYA